MGLAAVAPAERLVAEHQGLVHDEAGRGQEEPFPLAAIGGVLAAIPGLGPEALARLGGPDLGGLERLLGLEDGADRGGVGHGGDEPVPLVVAAEVLVLLAAVADHQEQVPFGGPDVQDGDLGIAASGRDDLEELAVAVGLHVERKQAERDSGPPGGAVGDLEPGPDPGELGEQIRGVHRRASLRHETRVVPGRFAETADPSQVCRSLHPIRPGDGVATCHQRLDRSGK